METVSLCEKCNNRKACSEICRPVEIWLREGQTLIFEDKIGNITVNYGQDNEIRFSEIERNTRSNNFGGDHWQNTTIESSFVDPERKNRPDYIAAAEETLDDFRPKQLRSQIFYKRFFEQKSNKDVAAEMDISINYCSSVYAAARKRLLKIVEALDGRDFGLRHIQSSKRSFTDREQLFLLNKVFHFSASELSRMPGAPKRKAIQDVVNKMHDKYKKTYFEQPVGA